MRFAQLFIMGLSLVLVTAGTSFGAGFAIIEQSVTGLGNAFAGVAATAEDATTVFFNPAGMTRIKGQQVVVGTHFIIPRSDFSGEAQTADFSAAFPTVPGLPGPVPIAGSTDDGGENAIVPNLYYVYNPENTPWAFGIGVNAPFGLVTEWDRDWVGRYHAVKSDVQTININPAVAYKVDDHFSVALGVSAQQIDAELSSAVDFGSILMAAAGGIPTQNDGFSVLEADDWAYTYNIGILYEADENTRLGIHYRSQVNYTAKGDARFEYGNLSAAQIALLKSKNFADTNASADISLPANVSMSVYHRCTPRLAIMADATITFWSSFDELRVVFDNGLQDNVTTENWEDSWRLSLGGTYSLNDRMDLRFGIAYDQTPIPSPEYRTPRIPGEDRLWIAGGFGYRLNEAFKLDFAYTHIFVKDADINKRAGLDPTGENFFRGDLVGVFDNTVDIASLQLTYSF
ncbi:OmpP1/FadL family transporter [Geothermobacter hydrogeniphilus]|uniref:Long-chain fatty acid transport protein n=1 Tax=Geothermobacter hydrogeniphilus TaxID=1969733 RepID=A0A1X0YEG7_9BACT|nr:outer membrane protein transport protein [Geothermobacter hydrogeniphilus]ORJ63580.1 hypothetical protein B5V00_01550 [Geothermobacter hydrogeniphilus]